jgi:hypothetical protein
MKTHIRRCRLLRFLLKRCVVRNPHHANQHPGSLIVNTTPRLAHHPQFYPMVITPTPSIISFPEYIKGLGAASHSRALGSFSSTWSSSSSESGCVGESEGKMRDADSDEESWTEREDGILESVSVGQWWWRRRRRLALSLDGLTIWC